MKTIKLSENEIIKSLRDLDYQEIYDKTSNYLLLLKEAKKLIKESKIDLVHLTADERQALRFRTWSKESGEYTLIPLYISKLLLKETLVICPLFKDSQPEPIGKVDDDIIAGCIAYQFYFPTEVLNEDN